MEKKRLYWGFAALVAIYPENHYVHPLVIPQGVSTPD